MDPARVVGGDYYDFLEHRDGSLGIVVADVAGKGLPAAMLMPAVNTALRTLAQRSADCADALRELNQVLYENTGASNYATVFYAALNLESGLLRYSNAGHLPGLVWRVGGQVEWLSDGGTPVGLLPSSDYALGETRLGPGDILVLYTDGVVEQIGPDDQQFGEDRLLAAVSGAHRATAEGIADAIREAVLLHRGDSEQTDDATVIAVKAPRSKAA